MCSGVGSGTNSIVKWTRPLNDLCCGSGSGTNSIVKWTLVHTLAISRPPRRFHINNWAKRSIPRPLTLSKHWLPWAQTPLAPLKTLRPPERFHTNNSAKHTIPRPLTLSSQRPLEAHPALASFLTLILGLICRLILRLEN